MAIHLNEGGHSVLVRGEAKFESMGMELFANKQITHEARGVDDARKSAPIEGNATLKHLDVGRENEGEVVAFEMGLNEGVPSKGVPQGDFVEQLAVGE